MRPKIELENTPEDIRRERIVGRMGYALLGFIVPMAAVGLFGGGFLWQESEQAGGAVLRYPGVCRMHHDVELEMSLPAGATAIAYPLSLLDTFEIVSIAPAPDQQEMQGDSVLLRFVAQDAAASSGVKVKLRADRPSRVDAALLVEGQGALPLRMWVLP